MTSTKTMAPPQFCTRTVYKRLPGSGPAEAVEEEGFRLEMQQRDGVRKVEEPLTPYASSKQWSIRGEELVRKWGEWAAFI